MITSKSYHNSFFRTLMMIALVVGVAIFICKKIMKDESCDNCEFREYICDEFPYSKIHRYFNSFVDEGCFYSVTEHICKANNCTSYDVQIFHSKKMTNLCFLGKLNIRYLQLFDFLGPVDMKSLNRVNLIGLSAEHVNGINWAVFENKKMTDLQIIDGSLFALNISFLASCPSLREVSIADSDIEACLDISKCWRINNFYISTKTDPYERCILHCRQNQPFDKYSIFSFFLYMDCLKVKESITLDNCRFTTDSCFWRE